MKKAAICVFNPQGGQVYAFRVKVLPFGSSRSPANWGGVVKFAQHLLMGELKIVTCCFADDLYTCERIATAMSSFLTARQLTQLLGLQLPPKKDQGHAKQISLLGAELVLGQDSVTITISKRRACNLIEFIRSIIQKQKSPSGLATKLRGKLGFAASLGYGKIGRGTLRPLARRQYSTGVVNIATEIALFLEWRVGFLENTPPGSAPLREEIVAPVHSGTMGFGHIGVK